MRISVITATWNNADTLRDCLASVADQTHSELEHCLVDNESQDGTQEIIHSYIADKGRGKTEFNFVSEADSGIYDALNKGLARITGDVVGFLHADDTFASADVLSSISAAFADSSVTAVYGDLQYVRKRNVGAIIRHWQSAPFTPRRLAWGWMPPHPTLYVRREWYERIGGFDTRYRIAADYFSILQLFSEPDFKSVYLPKVLVKMRLGGASNNSLRNVFRKSSEDLDALRRSGVGVLGGYGTLVLKNLSKLTQIRF